MIFNTLYLIALSFVYYFLLKKVLRWEQGFTFILDNLSILKNAELKLIKMFSNRFTYLLTIFTF